MCSEQLTSNWHLQQRLRPVLALQHVTRAAPHSLAAFELFSIVLFLENDMKYARIKGELVVEAGCWMCKCDDAVPHTGHRETHLTGESTAAQRTATQCRTSRRRHRLRLQQLTVNSPREQCCRQVGTVVRLFCFRGCIYTACNGCPYASQELGVLP